MQDGILQQIFLGMLKRGLTISKLSLLGRPLHISAGEAQMRYAVHTTLCCKHPSMSKVPIFTECLRRKCARERCVGGFGRLTNHT